MKQVTLWILAPFFRAEFYPISRSEEILARELFNKGAYVPVTMDDRGGLAAEEVAEEMFDLTNNPSREEERERDYGRGPSLSTGDIVQVGDVKVVCCSFGWKRL